MSACLLRRFTNCHNQTLFRSTLHNAILEVRVIHCNRRAVISSRLYGATGTRCSATLSGNVIKIQTLGNNRRNPVVFQQLRYNLDDATRRKRLETISKTYVNSDRRNQKRIRDGLLICVGIILFFLGISMAAVPLYKMFCSATGYGGTTKKHTKENNEKVRDMEPVEWRPVTVSFSGTVNPELDWEFTPVEESVTLVPGETCLAFFTATNKSSHVVTGISTYNVTPFEAGAYFNKIQCFCFDEQTLNPGEELDMPVFFYIDPEFALDATLIRMNCTEVSLHYTFFDTEQPRKVLVELGKDIAAFVKGEATSPPEFIIPDKEGVVKINDDVYKDVIRKGYDKEFIYPGCTAVIHVTGTIADTGKIFWTTKGDKPFTFTAGTASVIAGWDEGCLGMSEGEISKIYMSSMKGYGKQGNKSWNIPRYTNLAFEIEVMAVR